MSMLQAFSAAARTQSFTGAATELGLTQGAISRQVRALEHQLGVELFARVRKSVRLTDAGKRYAEEIEKALQTIRLATLNAMTADVFIVRPPMDSLLEVLRWPA